MGAMIALYFLEGRHVERFLEAYGMPKFVAVKPLRRVEDSTEYITAVVSTSAPANAEEWVGLSPPDRFHGLLSPAASSSEMVE